MTLRAIITGTGSYLPEKCLSNHDVEKIVDTTHDWIFARTGINQRHIAAEGEATSDMAAEAAKKAMVKAGVTHADIDLIIVATTTPDLVFPSTAVLVQDKLGVRQGAAFDVQAVCSGFIYAMTQADNMIRLGQAKCALVIGAEICSRILDWKDRSTCVLFGDGAGALILEAEECDERKDVGIIASRLRSDGRYRDKLYVDGGPSSTQTTGFLRMHGREVFRHAVNNISDVIEETLQASNFSVSDIDWFVPHQANERILAGTAKKIGLPIEKVIMTVATHGNTSAASIPLALNYGVETGKIKKGDLVLLEAMGGGFTWGAVLLRW